MTRFTKDVIDAPHTQREMSSIPHQGNTLKGFKAALDDLGAIYHGTPHHQAASLAAKDAEISQLASALNKSKEENERLREALCGAYEAMRSAAERKNDMARLFAEHIYIAKEALK